MYRNLKMMELDGEIGHLKCPTAPTGTITTPPHGHLLCDGCGHLADLPVVGLMREVEAGHRHRGRGYTLTIHYICPKCRAAKTLPPTWAE